jgi:hypothetical protein
MYQHDGNTHAFIAAQRHAVAPKKNEANPKIKPHGFMARYSITPRTGRKTAPQPVNNAIG